jgi:hypothetical protein
VDACGLRPEISPILARVFLRKGSRDTDVSNPPRSGSQSVRFLDSPQKRASGRSAPLGPAEIAAESLGFRSQPVSFHRINSIAILASAQVSVPGIFSTDTVD